MKKGHNPPVRIKSSLWELVKTIAKQNGISGTAQIEKIIEDWLKKESNK